MWRRLGWRSEGAKQVSERGWRAEQIKGREGTSSSPTCFVELRRWKTKDWDEAGTIVNPTV